jgi:pimeloyl-ACP methyl ester carboxylesterase
MSQPAQHRVASLDAELNVTTLGNPANPALLMVHGIRDVAANLIAVAEPLAENYYVVVPDLRGHGDSDSPGGYAFWQFVYDLHRVAQTLQLERPALLGHSLGGQIAANYAALFSDDVNQLIVVEGLGPPLRPIDTQSSAGVLAQRQRMLDLAALPARGRPLPSMEFAINRLLVNNPGLAPERARWLAQHSTRHGPDGNLFWKFDQRVAQIWLGVNQDHNQTSWRAIACPTLVITGARAHEYWASQMPIPGWDGRFSAADLNARLACFRNVRHIEFDAAGHMVHFDSPQRLAHEVAAFLRAR